VVTKSRAAADLSAARRSRRLVSIELVVAIDKL
jgi:hypothetical protein